MHQVESRSGVDGHIPPEKLGFGTTIDKIIQHIAERELEKALAEHKAKGYKYCYIQEWEILALAQTRLRSQQLY